MARSSQTIQERALGSDTVPCESSASFHALYLAQQWCSISMMVVLKFLELYFTAFIRTWTKIRWKAMCRIICCFDNNMKVHFFTADSLWKNKLIYGLHIESQLNLDNPNLLEWGRPLWIRSLFASQITNHILIKYSYKCLLIIVSSDNKCLC